jgi:hypothetical protein
MVDIDLPPPIADRFPEPSFHVCDRCHSLERSPFASSNSWAVTATPPTRRSAFSVSPVRPLKICDASAFLWAKPTYKRRASQVKLTLTHEEISEILGTIRETVSRLFSKFKKKQLLQFRGSIVVIRNRPLLEKIAPKATPEVQ